MCAARYRHASAGVGPTFLPAGAPLSQKGGVPAKRRAASAAATPRTTHAAWGIKMLARSLLDESRAGRSNTRPHPGGQVAQLVEQRTENPRVGGSIPPLATIQINLARASSKANGPGSQLLCAGPGHPSSPSLSATRSPCKIGIRTANDKISVHGGLARLNGSRRIRELLRG